MSNVYGFDFLKTDHKTNESDQPPPPSSSQSNVPITTTDIPFNQQQQPTQKSDLEKQHDVIKFLKNHRSSGCLPPSILYNRIGVDLQEGGDDETVRSMLLQNKLIKVEEEPDPENPSLTILKFGYQAKFNNVRNKTGLLAQINKSKYGIRRMDLLDSYEGVENDINSLITAGEIMGLPNSEDKNNYILFPRGEPFYVELDGHIGAKLQLQPTTQQSNNVSDPTVPVPMETNLSDSFMIETDGNPKKQIRRGEAVWVGGQWFRVSSAVKHLPLSEQPPRAQAPLTVTSYKDLSKKNDAEGYIRPFTTKIISLDHSLSTESIQNIRQGKEALTKLQKAASTVGGGGGRGITGGVSSQLLSSNATSDNYETLVEKFVFTSGGGGGHLGSTSAARRRPTTTTGATSMMMSGKSHYHLSQYGHKKKDSSSSSHIEEVTQAAKDPTLIYNHPRRHGCTLDLRELYLATKNDVPKPENEIEIFNMMIEYKLLDKNSKMKRPRMSEQNRSVDKDGKPMKRRYYVKKSDQLRNDHLKNTEIGDILQAALDKQSQGKAVGDGGM